MKRLRQHDLAVRPVAPVGARREGDLSTLGSSIERLEEHVPASLRTHHERVRDVQDIPVADVRACQHRIFHTGGRSEPQRAATAVDPDRPRDAHNLIFATTQSRREGNGRARRPL